MRENPCKPDCPKRNATCHSNCPEYYKFAEKNRQYLEWKMKQCIISGYEKSRLRRLQKRQGGSKNE